MKRTKLSLYFIFISFLTVFTFFISIAQSSYNNLIKPLNQVKESNITPIDPKLDLSVIDEIEKRDEYSEDSPLGVSGNTASSSPTRLVGSVKSATPSSTSANNQ